MRAVTVYRLDDSSNFSYHTRHPLGPYWNCEYMNEGTTTRTCCGWHGGSSRWIRGRRPRPHRRGARPAGISPGAEQWLYGGVVSKIPLLRMLVVGLRQEVMRNALDHYGHLVLLWFIGLVTSYTMGGFLHILLVHRGRGGTGQCPSRSKGRLTTMECFSGEKEGEHG